MTRHNKQMPHSLAPTHFFIQQMKLIVSTKDEPRVPATIHYHFINLLGKHKLTKYLIFYLLHQILNQFNCLKQLTSDLW